MIYNYQSVPIKVYSIQHYIISYDLQLPVQSVPINVYLIQHYIISHDLQLPISAYQGVLDTTLYNKS